MIELFHLTYKWDPNRYNNTKASARGVLVIVVGNGHDDTSSNPGRD